MAHLLQTVISKKAVLRFDFTPHLPAITGDATQIRQVVMNLITNASDALGVSTGVIRLRTGILFADQAYLSTTYLPQDLAEDYYAYLEVSDTGCGMDAATMERIFDPFYSTKFTGRGLGLAAVLGIVRGHQGAIKIDSQPGKGTTFKVLFPCSDQSSACADLEAGPSEHRRGTGKALVVDDEEVVRTLAARALELSGFEVVQAANGKQALQIIAADKRLALVLLDFSMPHMNGDESLRELRKLNPDAAVILMSGHPESEIAGRLAYGDLAGFVPKPFRPKELIATVRRALEKARCSPLPRYVQQQCKKVIRELSRGSDLLADVGQQGHEAGPLDGVLDGALEGGAVAAALAAKHLALAGAHLLQALHVLVIDECRPRATFLRAEPATVLAAATQLLANHSHLALKDQGFFHVSIKPSGY